MANDEAAPEVQPLEPLAEGSSAAAMHRPQTFRFSRPLRYFLRALVFLALIGFLVYILHAGLVTAVMANPGLNGLILGALAVGILITLRELWRVDSEARAATRLAANPAGVTIRRNQVISPLGAVLPALERRTLAPAQAATLLESIAVRLDDGREVLRYIAGLLVFLGLLGTFWGLLDTISSIGNVIKSLRTGAESGVLFDELKTGLAAPLAGMALSFSASLFGIAGAVLLGFLDLQLGQAQRRFRNEVEDYLGSATANSATIPLAMPVAGSASGDIVVERLDKLQAAMQDGSNNRAATQALANLAEGIQGLVQHMRSEQQLIRDWVEAQAAREKDLKRLIERLAAERVGES
ncbi:MotA/TolQ/ExbB proton channel family protein [Bosea vestrisii]|uniref:MotA/TolQ/ExbB proton channel family protein n=1 Tax=Bosea vestrisii TaxID=151416 RepID=UPI0024DFEA9F|nr:MotA/TolQ/ExbB proton channel family protein [Bosea vestrisii]WID98069.1 MotA/TolQ/ExbB proton channel family protein [Bosea vestrisii]